MSSRTHATGKFRGVSIDLGSALAKKLGVPVEFLPHLASGEIQNEAASGKWDVTFMPVDEERKKFVDFGNAYHLLQSTYLVAPGSKLTKVEEANDPGVRIGGVANTATFRAAQHTAPKATFVTVAGVDAAVAAMKAGEIDCIALSRESLSGLAAKIPGSRVLDGGFLNSSTAVAVPKSKPAALAYVSQFIEEAKAVRTGPQGLRRHEPQEFAGGAGRDETIGVACYSSTEAALAALFFGADRWPTQPH